MPCSNTHETILHFTFGFNRGRHQVVQNFCFQPNITPKYYKDVDYENRDRNGLNPDLKVRERLTSFCGTFFKVWENFLGTFSGTFFE